jgi:hypothetical protein
VGADHESRLDGPRPEEKFAFALPLVDLGQDDDPAQGLLEHWEIDWPLR